MAFVKSAPQVAPPDHLPSEAELIAQLSSAETDARRLAARGLSGRAVAAEALASRLDVERDSVVRAALFASLVEIGGARVAGLVGPLLRNDDAGVRGGAIEALQRLASDAASVVDVLLSDPDPDVRLLAVEVTRAWPAELALPRLRRVLDADPHVNVCAAAVDVVAEVGAHDLVASLARLRRRFADEAFLVFAIDIACPESADPQDRDT